jgi:hypothetical protein
MAVDMWSKGRCKCCLIEKKLNKELKKEIEILAIKSYLEGQIIKGILDI